MTPRRALVSGASSGIGRATVRALVADGWDVVATARRSDRLETLAEETGCEVFTADLTRDEDVAALAEFAGSTGLDAVVNVAGGALGVDRIDEEPWYARRAGSHLSLPVTRARLGRNDPTPGSEPWRSPAARAC